MQSEAALKLFSKLKRKERRIHLSPQDNIVFFAQEQPINDEMRLFRKPKGLWYGINDSWIDWCHSESMGWVHNYIHEVILDTSKILRISNIKEFEAFEDEYSDIDPILAELSKTYPNFNATFDGWQDRNHRRRGMNCIRFDKVAEKYSGIEITPYLWEKRLESMWYYGWDCASGCVWNPDAVLDVNLFASFDEVKQTFIRSALQRKRPVVE